MKIIFSKASFTLVELIISSLLVIVVLLGMFSINMVLSNNSQDYGQRYLLNSQTQTTLDHILNNAALAVGSANCNDEAILSASGRNPCSAGPTVPGNSFCIHQGPNNNLVNSASNIWLCYSWVNTAANPNQIEWCAETYPAAPGNDPRGATSCTDPAVSLVPGTSVTFLGTANTGQPGGANGLTTQFLSNVFSITLYNCLNNADAATCNGLAIGVTKDPVNNPEIQLSGSVSPTQASM